MSAATCPSCHATLTSADSGEPWCPACEWGLDDPVGHEVTGAGWIDRLLYRSAFRLNRVQFGRFAGRAIGRPGYGAAGVFLVAVSVVLLGGELALLALAGWLAYAHLSLLTAPLILLILGVVWVLLPRFPGLPDEFTPLDRSQAPTLFALVERVAAASGTPAPHFLGVDTAFNAYATPVGLRRRRAVCLGLPLWAALPPEQRVALLGHKLGHFANGDPRVGLLTFPALNTFQNLADLTRMGPPELWGCFAAVVDLVARPVMWVISRSLLLVHVAMTLVGARQSQRAEYHADELAVLVAGSSATRGLADSLASRDGLEVVVRRAARTGHDARDWRRAAEEARASMAPRVPRFRQLSIRTDTSVLASHPPAGLRARLVESRPWQEARVGLSEYESDRIDSELAEYYRRNAREIGWVEH
ncbi:M48 family metalloprotease [Longispora sp. NPDC051575]|uniref:M48 family metalloprotease n=1 Tax=Longispora sp. NPDC051575 TaxID=3154943 RepID=UPI00342B6FC6